MPPEGLDVASRPPEPQPPHDSSEKAVPAFSEEGIAFIQLLMKFERTEWSAPYPSPTALAAFEQISSGLARDLVAMTGIQQAHDNAMERNALRWEGARSIGGLLSGLTIALFMIGVSGWLIDGGHDIAGSVLGGGTIISLVTVFLKRDREPDAQPAKPKPRRKK